MGQCSVVQPYLRDQDVLRLDVPVETVVEVTEVDGLQCLPDDALHSRRVQMSASPARDCRQLCSFWDLMQLQT